MSSSFPFRFEEYFHLDLASVSSFNYTMYGVHEFQDDVFAYIVAYFSTFHKIKERMGGMKVRQSREFRLLAWVTNMNKLG